MIDLVVNIIYLKVKTKNYKNLKKPTLTVEGKDIKICLPNKYKKLNRDEILIKLIFCYQYFLARLTAV